jgi:hypothetical protein
VIKYKRKDGVDYRVLCIYLLVMTRKKEKNAITIWAYPAIQGQNSAGQVNTKSKMSLLFLVMARLFTVTKGYVVLDDAAFLIGEGNGTK